MSKRKYSATQLTLAQAATVVKDTAAEFGIPEKEAWQAFDRLLLDDIGRELGEYVKRSNRKAKAKQPIKRRKQSKFAYRNTPWSLRVY